MAKVLRAPGMNKCIGCFTCQIVCSGTNHKTFSTTKSAIRIRTLGGKGAGGDYFATYCHACEDRACMDICPTSALTKRKGGGVVFHKDLCIGCKKCGEVCDLKAIYFERENGIEYPIICKHCGVCTRYCPHKCLEMEVVPDVE